MRQNTKRCYGVWKILGRGVFGKLRNEQIQKTIFHNIYDNKHYKGKSK